MARVDNLSNFLSDVADAIRTKKGSEELIAAEDFDTEIENLPSGGGADLSEYFYTELNQNTGSSTRAKVLKKCPDLIVADTVTSLAYMFYYNGNEVLPKVVCNDNVTNMNKMFENANKITEVDLSGLNTSNVTNMERMFYSCGSLTKLDLKTFDTSSLSIAYNMFYMCPNLTFLDIRTFEYSKLGVSASLFQSVPNNCEIIVKNTTEKDWINTNVSRLTNVKTVAEYEAEQNA